MKPQVVGPESIHCVVDGDLLEKLKLTFPEERPGGCIQLKTSCGNVKRLLERFGALLAFHLASVVAAICGLVAVAVLLMWTVGGAITYVVVLMPLRLASRLPPRLAKLCYWVLVASYGILLVAAMRGDAAFRVFNILMLCAASGVGLYHHAASIVYTMVSIDAQLANFINKALSDDSAPEKVLQPKDCAKRFKIDALRQPDEPPSLLSVIALTTRLGAVVLYFGVCKVLVGTLSAVSIFCSVIQPAISVFSGGDAPIFSMAFHPDPIAYVVLVISCCMAGGVGLVLVAVLSVKLTWRVFGESIAEEEQAPATPTQNATATSFTPLKSATAIAAESASM